MSDDRNALQQAATALRAAMVRIQRLEREKREPIAVIGMGCRFPGGASDPERFWDLLTQGRDAVSELPTERSRDSAARTHKRKAGWLEDVAGFDARFFDITAREAAALDPQQRLALEVVWEALEDAQLPPSTLEKTASSVYLGSTARDYQRAVYRNRDSGPLDLYALTGTETCFAPGRIAYHLGLHGPCFAIDTACSSSLAALHLASRSLRSGESDLALVVAVNLILQPEMTEALAGTLSPDAKCKAFAAGANGFVRAEGAGALVLKRLSEAERDGDPIWAVLRGSAVNHDGRSAGLTAPNSFAQEAVIRSALADAGLEPRAVSFVETHGTGTELGDPIEFDALNRVYGAAAHGGSCALGAVKSNLGHLEAAAGMAGVIKAILSLWHGVIPRNLHLAAQNPLLSLAGTRFCLPTCELPWPRTSGERFAAVSGFGMSGTNAHVVLGEPPKQTEAPRSLPRRCQLLPISARSESSLRASIERHAALLDRDHSVDLAALSHAASAGRDHFEERSYVVLKDRAQAVFALHAEAGTRARFASIRPDAPPRVGVLFTGQGAQYAGMGRALYETEPAYRVALQRCAAFLEKKGIPLLSLLHDVDSGMSLDETRYTQPALFCLEYALFQLFSSWGVQPSAVMGHSVGEFVAACVAGVFELEGGLELILARGNLMQSLPSGGGMLAVQCTERALAELNEDSQGSVVIAARNAPDSLVLAGPLAPLEAMAARLVAAGIKNRKLNVSHAFHSPLMRPMLAEFERTLARVELRRPTLPIVSNVSGALIEEEIARPAYWLEHVLRPVEFAAGMRSLRQLGCSVFLELGPHPILAAIGADCIEAGAEVRFVPTLRRNIEADEGCLEALGALYCAGANVDWKKFSLHTPKRRIALPRYSFDRKRHWIATHDTRESTASEARSQHEQAERAPGPFYRVEWLRDELAS